MDIMSLIEEQLNNPETLSKLGQSVGVDSAQVQKLARVGMPAILQALGRNASSPEGAAALAGALEQHQDDNVADVKGFLSNVNTDDGAKMLQHIFAEKNETVQGNLAKQTGLGTDQVSGVLTQLAPLLLGALGQQKKEQGVDASGLESLLGSFTNSAGSSDLKGMVTNLLDSDKDGSIVDDVGGFLKGFLKK